MATSQMVSQLDQIQRTNRVAGVLVATAMKFKEDRATRLASMIAFWAFFSIFPLFLLAVSLLGFFLPSSTKSDVLHHVSALFPLLDPSSVGSLGGTAWAVVLGGATALWGGMAVMRSIEYAFNSVWSVPMDERPKIVEQAKRAVFALSTIGVGLVASTVISGFVTGQNNGVNLGGGGRAAGYVIAAALDVFLFLVAFRVLTDRGLTFRDVLPGALLSGVTFWILEQLSSFIISRHLQHVQTSYGHFATVITVLWWFYLQAIVTLFGAQLNVVLRRKLYPRSLGGKKTEADERTLAFAARVRTYEEHEGGEGLGAVRDAAAEQRTG